jgi:uncharacterized repeat protein (TIGR03803 family)
MRLMIRSAAQLASTAAASLVLLLLFAALASAQAYSVLYDLGHNAGDPMFPTEFGAVAQGRDGNLYTTSPSGGAHNVGAVFMLTPDGQLTVLHSFTPGSYNIDGYAPTGGLTLGRDGNFYGTTASCLARITFACDRAAPRPSRTRRTKWS